MTKVAPGATVSIHYTGTLDDGSTFDSSEGRDPLNFVMGEGQIIPGLEAALADMALGEKKTVTIPAAQAYGPHNAEATQDIPRDSVPDHIPLEIGTPLQVQTQQGQTLQVTISAVTEEKITLDANHPLAGKDLTFAVEVVAVS